MAKTRFKVVATMMNSKPTEGTVEIDRSTGVFSVRPHRMHRKYELPLSDVAQMVVQRIVIAEAAEKKPRKKRVRRGLLA
jgi:predicted nucleic acid-binding Zn ribbon protein